jgi:outer membrane protein OmpA-like peptidoglycan-associated protein
MQKIINLFILIFALSFQLFSQNNLINAIALPNGSYIVSSPLSYAKSNSRGIAKWSPEGLADGTETTGWCASKNVFPMAFVIELSETYAIEKLCFSNMGESKYPGICAKEIKVEFSTTKPDAGFTEVLKTTLGDFSPMKEFPIPPQKARWIKVSILSNYGHATYTELMEMQAWGHYANVNVPAFNLSGKWKSNWGDVELQQVGTSVTGSYPYNDGNIPFGGIERRMLTFKWTEKKTNGWGMAALALNEESTRLTGIWCHGGNLAKYGFWIFEKGESANLSEKLSEAEVANKLKQEMDKEGKLIMYGINFEFNSAVIKVESEEVLKQILYLLNATPTLKINIEGHTDNAGEESYNQQLSERRAMAVKDFLVQKYKVSGSKITAIGKGEKFPIADNNIELGKAANRRVEIYPQSN